MLRKKLADRKRDKGYASTKSLTPTSSSYSGGSDYQPILLRSDKPYHAQQRPCRAGVSTIYDYAELPVGTGHTVCSDPDEDSQHYIPYYINANQSGGFNPYENEAEMWQGGSSAGKDEEEAGSDDGYVKDIGPVRENHHSYVNKGPEGGQGVSVGDDQAVIDSPRLQNLLRPSDHGHDPVSTISSNSSSLYAKIEDVIDSVDMAPRVPLSQFVNINTEGAGSPDSSYDNLPVTHESPAYAFLSGASVVDV